MRLKLIAFVGLGIVASCTSLSKKANLPPPHLTAFRVPASTEQEVAAREIFLTNFKKENSDPQSQWWADYNLALLWKNKDKEKACDAFKQLASQSEFPLHEVSKLRAVEVCPPQPSSLEDLAPLEKISWLAPTAVQIGLKITSVLNDRQRKMEFTFQSSFHKEAQKEKVELVQKALLEAQALNDSESKERYTNRLYALAPRYLPNPPYDEWFKVAQDFRRVRLFKDARSFYHRILRHKTSTFDDQLKAHEGLRMAFKQEGDKESFLKATREMAKFVEKSFKKENRSVSRSKDYLAAQTALARALWTEARTRDAIQTLEKTEKKLGSRVNLAELYWLRARIEEEEGSLTEALRWNQLATNQVKNETAQWEALLWQSAWLHRKAKNYKESIAKFEELKLKFKDSNSISKYMFWLGRLLKDDQDEVRALLEFRQLVEIDPLGYYGIMAQRELGVPFESLTQQPLPKLDKPSPMSDVEYSQILWLLSLGESDLARELVGQVASRERTNKLSASDLQLMLKFQARVGVYLSLFENLGQWALDEKKGLLRESPELIFPRPFTEVVQSFANTNSIPQELVFSIMRQESAFNPRARSPVDAFGLMQLTPGTVQDMGAATQLGYKEPDDLYDPKTNIALGTLHLRALLKKWKEQYILTVASYNASEKAVLGWINSRFDEDPVEFIEEIPYAETQGYVKLVLRNYVFYMRLNSAGQAVPFPEWWLEGLQHFKRYARKPSSQINKPSNIKQLRR